MTAVRGHFAFVKTLILDDNGCLFYCSMKLDHASVVSRINLSAVRGHFAFAKTLILDSLIVI